MTKRKRKMPTDTFLTIALLAAVILQIIVLGIDININSTPAMKAAYLDIAKQTQINMSQGFFTLLNGLYIIVLVLIGMIASAGLIYYALKFTWILLNEVL